MVKGGLWLSWLACVRPVLTFLMSLIEPVVPTTACSQNIAQIFGTNTNAFELLVLKRKIMGPCWIQIKHPKVDNKGVAGCHLYPLPFVCSLPIHVHRSLGVT